MDYRNGPRHRGSHPPRMPRGGGGHPHQIQQQPRGPTPVMSAWQTNTMNAYPNQEESMTPYQQPAMEYHHNYIYSQTPEIPPTYGSYQPYCTIPPMYPVDHQVPIFHQGTQPIPMATTPTPTPPPRVASPAPKLMDLQYKLRCSKCQLPNSLIETELIKKDEVINTLQQQLNEALAEIEELKIKLNEQIVVPEVGMGSASLEEEDDVSSLSAKMSQLSPDAIEFNPTKGTDNPSQFPNDSSNVPVVSAKGINDDSSSEAQIDLGEESQAEEPLKQETQSERTSPSPVQQPPPPPPVVSNPVETVQETIPDIPLVADSSWYEPEPTTSEAVAIGQQESEENNPKVPDPNWADDERSVKSTSASDGQNRPNYDNKFRGNPRFPPRKRDEYSNFRGKYHRRGDQDGYNKPYRGTNDRGGRYGNRPLDYSDRYHRDQDQTSINGPQNDNEHQFRDREDSCRGSTESLRDTRPQHYRGGGRRGNFSYRDNYNNRQDRDWNQDQSRGDGFHRPRGGPRGGRSNDDGFNRYEKRYNQSNGGAWRSPPSHTVEVKSIVQEVQADLFSAPLDFSLGHCVAKDFRMGSGIAVKFKNMFKRVPELLAQEVDVGGCAYLKDPTHDRFIFYLVTKSISRGKPTYDTFKQALVALKEKCKEFNVTKLAIPHIGCGLDQLDWTKVKGMINETFQDLDIQITAYDFNAEGVPESEANNKHLNPFKVMVYYHHMELASIDAMTALVFLGTEDGHLDTTALSLDKRFNFALDYKKAQKTVGKLWYYDKPKDYELYSLIVCKSAKEKVTFANLESCVRELVKKLRKDRWEYLGIEAFVDWSEDKTFTERVVTLLRNTLPKPISQLWVCFREPAHDFWNMAKPQTPQQ